MKNQTDAAKRDAEILRKIRGGPTPENVVTAAKNQLHPWHKRFDWDDASAAHKHRLDTAREIIRSVHVRVISQTRVMYGPAYVRNPEPSAPQGYIETAKAASQRELAVQVMAQEMARIRGCIERARALSVQLGLEAEFDGLIADVMKVEERLEQAA